MEQRAAATPEKPEVVIYTDGGCRPNPGPGAYGAVLIHPKKRLEASGGFRRTTNNRMEIYAAIAGLELLKTRCKVTLYSDSQYLVKAMTLGWAAGWKKRGGWKADKQRAANYDLWLRLLDLCQQHEVSFHWVRGHAGNIENERCDSLSSAAMDKPNLPIDQGYENQPSVEESRPKLTKQGEPCYKCGAAVIKQTSQKKKERDFYYEYYLLCPKCGASYQVEEARREVPKTASLFGEE